MFVKLTLCDRSKSSLHIRADRIGAMVRGMWYQYGAEVAESTRVFSAFATAEYWDVDESPEQIIELVRLADR